MNRGSVKASQIEKRKCFSKALKKRGITKGRIRNLPVKMRIVNSSQKGSMIHPRVNNLSQNKYYQIAREKRNTSSQDKFHLIVKEKRNTLSLKE